MSVNIKGLNKVDLLRELYYDAFESPWACVQKDGFNDDMAREAVKGYIDYFQGRAIKCDLSKDTVDPRLYDRDAGAGQFQKVVDCLRNE